MRIMKKIISMFFILLTLGCVASLPTTNQILVNPQLQNARVDGVLTNMRRQTSIKNQNEYITLWYLLNYVFDDWKVSTSQYAHASGTSVYATTASTAGSAHNAQIANTANNADRARDADSADFAVKAEYAHASGTSLFAITSGSGGGGGGSATSLYAHAAGTSTYARNSTYAQQANLANVSDWAENSQVANFALAAEEALTANYSKVSSTSLWSELSKTSIYANTSGTSVWSRNSDTAAYAAEAFLADFATYANTAGTSVYSILANNSRTSDYANFTSVLTTPNNTTGGSALDTTNMPGAAPNAIGANVFIRGGSAYSSHAAGNVIIAGGMQSTSGRKGSILMYDGDGEPGVGKLLLSLNRYDGALFNVVPKLTNSINQIYVSTLPNEFLTKSAVIQAVEILGATSQYAHASGTSLFAITSGSGGGGSTTSLYAHAAGTSVWANAAFASINADNATTANTAGYAASAGNAQRAETAFSSTLSLTADYALASGSGGGSTADFTLNMHTNRLNANAQLYIVDNRYSGNEHARLFGDIATTISNLPISSSDNTTVYRVEIIGNGTRYIMRETNPTFPMPLPNFNLVGVSSPELYIETSTGDGIISLAASPMPSVKRIIVVTGLKVVYENAPSKFVASVINNNSQSSMYDVFMRECKIIFLNTLSYFNNQYIYYNVLNGSSTAPAKNYVDGCEIESYNPGMASGGIAMEVNPSVAYINFGIYISPGTNTYTINAPVYMGNPGTFYVGGTNIFWHKDMSANGRYIFRIK